MKTLTTTNIRFVILKKLEEYIYMPVYLRMGKDLENIVRRNDAFSNSDKRVFWYRGEKWSSDMVFNSQGVPRLHEELHPVMDKYVDERNYIRNVEGPLVSGFLRCILNHSKDAREMLSLIPVSLQDPIMGLLKDTFDEIPCLSTDQVAEIVKAPQNATEAIKTRMMRNMLEG
ncbi:hypothetical protein HWB52_gp77 [Pseudomonas phage Littlefix]|uniref:Uncharacterized protein n=1 Tax=Pseudomonas phage Littlefix TaxID=2079289 RepID=A0A2K9VHY2_9CAUD|nr:hypothetical protein HWB52_gp77 [Pseudomonas phage Littlefix]AUV61892.1 hypothetical protein PsPhLittlefix_gp77 [Pseudomonas phage Littlefix]